MKKFVGVLIGFVSTIFASGSEASLDMAPQLYSSPIVTEVVSNAFSDSKMAEKNIYEREPPSKTVFYYVRFAVAESNLAQMNPILPGFGVGYRRISGDGSVDISINGIGLAEHKNSRILWSFPKASYIRYLQPHLKQSYYVGGGLAWGGISSKQQSFIGIVPSVTGGYEFFRKSNVLGFTELNISQPAIAVYREGSFPGTIAEFKVGVGF